MNTVLQNRFHTSRGFTLIELLVTMVLIGILLRIGVPSFISFQRNSELTSAANSLLASINAARTESMKRNMNAAVVPSGSNGWAGGWTVFVDVDGTGSFDASKDLVVSTQPALASYFSVSATGTAGEASPYIMFNASGYPVTTSASQAQMTLSIARSDLSDASQIDQTRRVKIVKTGRVRICKPASASDAACLAADN